MTRLLLFLIALAAPRAEREWIVGDTVEELGRIDSRRGTAAARRWLWRETGRALWHAPRSRFAVRRRAPRRPFTKGDGLVATLWQDVRYALRLLGRSPGFTAVAIATLAIGIGANTAMFAVVNAVLLKPLPFPNATRLMLTHRLVPDEEAGPGVTREGVWSVPKYRTFAELQRTFDDTALFAERDYTVAGDREPERVRSEVVTDRYISILGIQPLLGRGFTYDEALTPGMPGVVMIGHGLWTRRYGADPRILGQTIQLNGAPYAIVGVLPRRFKGLNGNAELWAPLATTEPSFLNERQNHSFTIVGLRKADVSESAALAAVRLYGEQVDDAFREPAGEGRAAGAVAVSLYASRADDDIRRTAWLVLGAVGLVLLIACVNLTNLLVAKAIGRRREVAIRVAIGASRGRIARQFIVESVLLAGCGALGGLLVAAALLSAAVLLLPDSDVFFRTSMAPGARRMSGAAGLTRVGAGMIGLDPVTLLFTLGATVVTALLIASMPAIQASLLPPAEALKSSGSSGTAQGLHGFGARAGLVATQIAVALVLLTGAGLLIKSAMRLHGTSIGVASAAVLTLRIDLPRASYTPEAGSTFQTELVERVRAVPGVVSVGLGTCAPVSGGCSSTSIWFPPTRRAEAGRPLVGILWTTPDYFATLGIRLLRGRGFSERDRMGQPKVVLVNEAAVRASWPNADPIGKRIAVGQGGFHDGAEVIGVVSDVRYRTIETVAGPDVYVPLAQSYQGRMRLFVRSRLEVRALVAAIARQVRGLDPNLPLSEIKLMDERVDDAMWRTRVGAWLLSAFAALALLLTAIGVFGVMAQTVSQRTPEIGIRVALGAQRLDVLRLVFQRALLITAAGLGLGIGCALVLTRLIGSLLYEVEPTDPATFAAVAAIIGLVSLAACYLPARRATRVDAVVALRSE